MVARAEVRVVARASSDISRISVAAALIGPISRIAWRAHLRASALRDRLPPYWPLAGPVRTSQHQTLVSGPMNEAMVRCSRRYCSPM